jgi:ribosomal-protein-alanine N-acetyltransferase
VTPRLHSLRLDLEPLAVAHARRMYEGMRDAEIHRFIPYVPPKSVAELEATFRRRIAGNVPAARTWHNWTPVVRDTGDPIGNVQITIVGDGTALLGYFLLRTWWGRGYAREACATVIEWVGGNHALSRIVAQIDPRNTRSCALVTALGFALVGVHKNGALLKGELCDEARYELPVAAR